MGSDDRYSGFRTVSVDDAYAVERYGYFAQETDRICICQDSQFASTEETAEMITALLNNWIEKVQIINGRLDLAHAKAELENVAAYE